MGSNSFTTFNYAHRGLHNASQGVIENSMSAIQDAVEAGFGIEIDVQETSDHLPVVFHDFDLGRLTGASGDVIDHTAARLMEISYKESCDKIVCLKDVLKFIDGRVPVLVEVKSNWSIHNNFLSSLCMETEDYAGVLGFMSFDPEVILGLIELKCPHPLGLITTSFIAEEWSFINYEKRDELRSLVHGFDLDLSFIAHEISDLDSEILKNLLRQRPEIELLSWTVREKEQLSLVRSLGGAPIFEGALLTSYLLDNGFHA